MQTEESSVGVGAGVSDTASDNDIIEVEDNLQDDIADAYDELALAEGEKPAVEVKKQSEASIDEDLQSAVDELSGKEASEKAPNQKVESKASAAELSLKAPARFTAEEKEFFNKLPDKLKPAYKKGFDDMQADYTKTKQFLYDGVKQLDTEKEELAKERAEFGEMRTTVQRYLSKWGSQGVSPEKAIMALASVQDELTHPDKEVRKATYAKLLISSGLEPEDFAEILGGQVRQPEPSRNIVQPTLTPQEIQRQSYIDSLIARDQQLQAQSVNQQVQTVVNEIEAVREMKAQDGRYLYPKLHDPSFVERVKPLVVATMETTGCGWGEAFKRAYAASVPDFQVSQTRLPSGNDRSGATIVRQSPTIRSNGQPQAFPDWSKDDGMSLEDDIMASLELLKRGGAGSY
jgi:hypothetical protein